jgi:type I restriction enzyme, S subunit
MVKNWTYKSISELGKVITGKTPPMAEPKYFGGEFMFVSPKDLDYDHYYIHETETKITAEALIKFKNQILPPNSVLFTSLSYSFGKMGIAKERCLTNQQINSIIANQENDFRYIYYLLRANKENVFQFNSGIDTPIVPKSVFEKIKLSVPELKTQQRIASILSAYDDLIEVNNQRIKLLEETAREVYKEWFVRMRFPGYKKAKFVKGFPEGFGNIKYFKDFVKLNRGFDLPEEKIQDGIYPVVASTSIKAYHNQYKVKAPVITTGRSGSLGTVLFIDEDGWPLNTSLYVKNFFGNEPLYIYYTLMQFDFESFNSGAGVPTLNQNHLHKLKIWIAGEELQLKFKNLIRPIFQQVTILQKQNNELRQIRDRLLPRLISGKLQVKGLKPQQV